MHDPEGPGEHDAHLLDDDEPDLAPCAACGRTLQALATRCPWCGVAFEGQAWEGRVAGGGGGAAARSGVVIAAVVVAALLATWGYLWWA